MKIVIVGGTGTLGTELIKQLLLDRNNEIICVSRDELKQKQQQEFFKKNSKLSYRLGDIRDPESLIDPFRGSDYVFHVAALKHVDTCEDNPEEVVKTNILGTINVADVAVSEKVKSVVFSSTDKAVDPINVYGMTKGISEKILQRRIHVQNTTKFLVYRWGNVIGSRGSVIHSFIETLKKENKVYITHPDMTRFWIKIEEAVSFILSTYKNMNCIDPIIPKIKSASVIDIAQSVSTLLGIEKYETVYTGLRKGEKLHEVLRSIHSSEVLSSKYSEKLSREEIFDLISPFINKMDAA